jgi:pimeloyl-ACP methyl ester carboxylesterase
MEQEIQFCTTPDGVRIAHSRMGAGPVLVKAANWLSHLDLDLRNPVWRHWLAALSDDLTLVRYDERGCGLSDWEIPDHKFTFDSWVTDLETVVEAAGLERFALLGVSQGGPVAIAYAARHPERVTRLILYGTYAVGWDRRDFPEDSDLQREERRALVTLTRSGWGRDTPAYRQVFTATFVPDASQEEQRAFNEIQRASTSPENAARFLEEFGRIDVSALVPLVRAPTLLLHARGDLRVPFEAGRSLAARIPNCRFIPLDGRNHILLGREPAWETFVTEVRRFLGVPATSASPGWAGAAALQALRDALPASMNWRARSRAEGWERSTPLATGCSTGGSPSRCSGRS